MAVRSMDPEVSRSIADLSRAADLPEPALSDFSPDQLRFAASAWPLRAAEERRSALVFGALAQAARTLGVSEAWLSRFAAAARDESRHARLCAAVGAAFQAPPPRYDSDAVRTRLQQLMDLTQRTFGLLMIEVAIGESLSVRYFATASDGARETLTKTVLTGITRDETRHAELGWDALHALWSKLAGEQLEWLHEELRLGLASLEHGSAIPALRRLESGEPFDPVWGELGVLAPELRVELFYSSIELDVLPRLSRLGLDAQAAWRGRHRRATR
jgi:hypothetical protein